jgi:hypothetical protein
MMQSDPTSPTEKLWDACYSRSTVLDFDVAGRFISDNQAYESVAVHNR